MLIAIVPVVVLVLGLPLWALATKPVAVEAGRLMFACGLLVVLFVAARQTVHLP
jgi:hypothetical protein